MSNEDESLEQRFIEHFKNAIEKDLLQQFVEQYDDWTDKLKVINNLIKDIYPDASLYTYDEFCIKIFEITKEFLESFNYDKLYPTDSEYDVIYDKVSQGTNQFKEFKEKFKEEFKKEMGKRIVECKNNLLSVACFKGLIKHKTKDMPKTETVLTDEDLDFILKTATLTMF